MATHRTLRFILAGLLVPLLAALAGSAAAHGGVVEEDDLCVIRINFLKGHFKIFQPRTDGHREFCEDLPNATESVFVMEYLHDGLASSPVDFRIIRDVTGKGRFARWEDVEAIADIDAVTVFYREPTIEPDVLTVVHEFDREGDYIGIVTTRIGDDERVYRAVFPFEVGFGGFGYWPLILAVLVFLQVQYLVTSGRWAKWRAARRRSKLHVVLLLLSLPILAEADDVTSQRGLFELRYESSLEPIEINRMHSWVLQVRSTGGEPVTGAEIAIAGGMPDHDHGLPTRPRVTAELGDGRYRVDGIRFHMTGKWELAVTVEWQGVRDTAIITLRL